MRVVSATFLTLAAQSVITPIDAQRIERNLPYRANPALEQYLDVYRPMGSARAPVVLFIHGGSLEDVGERRNSPMYATVCPGLASREILCATMDYRLAPGNQWPAMPQDVAAAVRWLKDSIAARGGDPDRLFLLGHSSGCHLAALVALDASYLEAESLRTDALAGVVAISLKVKPKAGWGPSFRRPHAGERGVGES